MIGFMVFYCVHARVRICLCICLKKCHPVSYLEFSDSNSLVRATPSAPSPLARRAKAGRQGRGQPCASSRERSDALEGRVSGGGGGDDGVCVCVCVCVNSVCV